MDSKWHFSKKVGAGVNASDFHFNDPGFDPRFGQGNFLQPYYLCYAMLRSSGWKKHSFTGAKSCLA